MNMFRKLGQHAYLQSTGLPLGFEVPGVHQASVAFCVHCSPCCSPVRTASILHEPLAVRVKVQKEKKCVQDLCSRLSLLPGFTVTQAVITGG